MKIETKIIIFLLFMVVAFFVAIRCMCIIANRYPKVLHEEKRPLKVMRLAVLWALLTALCLFNGCVASYLSGAVPVYKDYTEKETVGVISYTGFPVWFCKSAPGIRSMLWERPNRIYANWCVWSTVFLLICCGMCFRKARSKKLLLFGLLLCVGCAVAVTCLLLTDVDHTILHGRATLIAVKKEVRAYADAHGGELPDSLDALMRFSAGGTQTLKNKNNPFIDPWKKIIEYERKEHGCTIRSSGPDRIMGTEDDITMDMRAPHNNFN